MQIVGRKKYVVLKTESDIDMAAELDAQFEHAMESQMDELDFFMEPHHSGAYQKISARPIRVFKEFHGRTWADLKKPKSRSKEKYHIVRNQKNKDSERRQSWQDLRWRADARDAA